MSGEFSFERLANSGNVNDRKLLFDPKEETLKLNLKYQISGLLDAILTCNEIGQVIYNDQLYLKKNINSLYHQLILSIARRNSLE